jgi:hypothetical protein
MSPAPANHRSRRWLRVARRRAALVIACTVVGAGAALLLGIRTPATYQAEAVVIVPALQGSAGNPTPTASGSGTASPSPTVVSGGNPLGSPDAAIKLASTYSNLIPLDDAVITAAALRAKTDATAFRKGLTVANDPGTALIRLDSVDKSADQAIANVTALATVLTQKSPPGQIAANALQTVQLPETATKLGESKASSALIGGLLGLLVGLVAAAALERADRRVDSLPLLGELIEAPVSDWSTLTPDDARALAMRWQELAGTPEPTVAVVGVEPLRQTDMLALLAGLGRESGTNGSGPHGSNGTNGKEVAPRTPKNGAARDLEPARGRDVEMVAAGTVGAGEGAEVTAKSSDLVVMLVPEGAKVVEVRRAVARLSDFGVYPRWGLLSPAEPVVDLEERLAGTS